MAAMLLVACWSAVRVWLDQPIHEHICPDVPAMVCPRCP
jgi:hypothetical protein